MSAKTGILIVSAAIVAAFVLVRGNQPAPVHAEESPPFAGIPLVPAAAGTVVDTAVFAGGCFWGIEAVFEHIKGVQSSVSGYTGGTLPVPSYDQVSTGRTGHAEAVRVVFDPAVVSYSSLLKVFFSVAHDPTELNRQGPDVGTQYRSALFYRDESQKAAATAYIDHLTKTKVFRSKIVTQVVQLTKFTEAEEYHQDYLVHHPDSMYIVINDAPKVARLKEVFPELWRD